MKHKKPNFRKTIWFIVLISLIFSIGYIVARMIWASPTEGRNSDHTLMLVQCCLGIVVLFVPDLIQRRFSKQIPSMLITLYYIFLYCAIYLGEVRSFYYLIPFWDDILHSFSSGMLGVFGFWLVDLLNETDQFKVRLSPIFVSLFSFCFALTVGTLWEIYEFAGDGLLGLNMQKFRLEDGTILVGHIALKDTMRDLIIDGCGAFVIATLGLIRNTRKEKENKTMIRNIIFDCSDTLLHLGSIEYLGELTDSPEHANDLHYRIFRSAAWHDYDCGLITAEQLETLILAELPEEEHTIAKTYLQNWNKHYSVIDGIPELLRELKEKGYKMYLLSDFPSCFEELWNQFDLFTLLDGRVISYEAGVRKSDENSLFEVLLKKYDLDKKECFFVDDSAACIEAANKIGIANHQFTNVASLRKALHL